MPKLEELLKYVSEHNDFYKKIIKDYKITDPTDIAQYPILTRQQLQENRYNMFSGGYINKYFSHNLRRQSSSGSSGVPVNAYWDYKDYYVSTLSLWRKRMQYYGIHPSDRYVMFTLHAFNVTTDDKTIYYKKEPANILSVNISLIHKEDKYQKLVELINEFSPVWLYIQPYVLKKLIYTYKRFEFKIPDSLKYIETVGELLSSDLRNDTLEFFKIPVANMYGSEEMNAIAYECPYHNMHILDENVFAECLNDSGIRCDDEGEAIITSVANKAMPLIRYNQGDRIVLKSTVEYCLCGSKSPIVTLLKGRSLDSIKINDNIELNSFMLLEIMSEINNRYDSIIIHYKYIYSKSEMKLQCIIEIAEKSKQWYQNIKRDIECIFWKKIALPLEVRFEILPMEGFQFYDKKYRVFEIKD